MVVNKYSICQVYKKTENSHISGQDKGYVLENRNEGLVAVALCDGAGSLKKSGEGAEQIAILVANFLVINWNRILTMLPIEIRNEIYIEIRKKLTELSQIYKCDKQEFGSTIMALVTDGNICFCIHLGDGEVVAQGNNEIHVISYPVNGHTPDSTYLTTGKFACENIRVYRFYRKYKKYMLITDGIDWKDSCKIKKIFDMNQKEIYSFMNKSDTNDDASLIKICFKENYYE